MKKWILAMVFLASQAALASDLSCRVIENYDEGTNQEIYTVQAAMHNTGTTLEIDSKHLSGIKITVGGFFTTSGSTQLTVTMNDSQTKSSVVIPLPAPSRVIATVFTREADSLGLICAISE